MKRRVPTALPTAIELLDEATHMVRRAPPAVLLTYYAGSMPFVLGLLFLWADLGRYQSGRIAAAFVTAFLYLGMKVAHSLYASRLLRLRHRLGPPTFSRSDLMRIATVQTTWQPRNLFFMPMALSTMIAAPWSQAFFHSLTVHAAMQPDAATVVSKARISAGLWPKATWALYLYTQAAYLLGYLNLLLAVLIIPLLLRIFTGEENLIAQNPSLVFSGTVQIVLIGLTFLVVNPLVLAIHTLRSFYAEARSTGEDLLVALREAPLPRRVAAEVHAPRPAGKTTGAAVLLLAALLIFSSPAAQAQQESDPAHKPAKHTKVKTAPKDAEPPAPANLTPEARELNREIDKTLSEPQYAWRAPHDATESRSLVLSLFAMVGGWIKAFFNLIGDIIDWFMSWFRPKHPGGSFDGPSAPPDGLQLLPALLLVGGLMLLGVALYLYARNRKKKRVVKKVVPAATIAVMPDLNREEVLASEMAENEWHKLARELAAKGEYRLAVRALYLATLADLAQRQLISIARFKSNRNYKAELARRARDEEDLRATFTAQALAFEEIWYGRNVAGPATLEEFLARQERMKPAGVGMLLPT